MFSSITIASSTTKPVAIVSAISVRMLSEKPARYITPNVPMSDSGTAMLGMIVAGDVAQEQERHERRPGRRRRSSSCCTSRTDARMRLRAIGQDREFSGRGRLAVELRQQRLDAIDDVDDVGAGLALHVDEHGGQLVRPGREPGVLGAVDDVGDVRRAAAARRRARR